MVEYSRTRRRVLQCTVMGKCLCRQKAGVCGRSRKTERRRLHACRRASDICRWCRCEHTRMPILRNASCHGNNLRYTLLWICMRGPVENDCLCRSSLICRCAVKGMRCQAHVCWPCSSLHCWRRCRCVVGQIWVNTTCRKDNRRSAR